MKLHKNIFFKILVGAGILLFVIVATLIIRSTSTVVAVVPNQSLKSGTTITSDMIKTINIGSNVPTGYITDKSSLIGQKLRVDVNENQLIYVNDVVTSWDELVEGMEVPENYVFTSVRVPDERAVGGLITAGDSIDIFGLPSGMNSAGDDYHQMELALGQMAQYDYYGEEGIRGYWVLANVKVLACTSALSVSEGNTMTSIAGITTEENDGSYYIIAVSYPDYQKLLLSSKYLDFWLNLVPRHNQTGDPLYDQMRQDTIKMMQDSQNQPKEYLEYKSGDIETNDTNQNNGLHDIGDNDNTDKLLENENTDETSESEDSEESSEKTEEKEESNDKTSN